MTWVKLDDQFTDHPKVIAAGPLAGWLYVCGLAYAARYLTDGHIPAAQVRRLADVADADELAGRLVHVGLWERVGADYRIHDYLDWNPPAEQIKRDREAAAERMRRLRSGETPAPAAPRSVEVRPNVRPNIRRSSATPVPVPVPVPADSRPGRSAAVAAGEGGAAPDSATPPTELLPFHDMLAGLGGYEPTAAYFAKVAEKYAGLDLILEAEKLRSWLKENPGEKCSTRRILNWLQGAQERAATRGGPAAGARNGSGGTTPEAGKYAAAVERARVY